MTYYNENDPKTAAWIRELIKEGHIPSGYVDERNIQDVKPHELTSYAQQHFFAGIAGWAVALRLAGWPDNRPVRTGSCPCQPFSQSGQRRGTSDERHLWPVFRDLITFGEATITFGEQVASPLGREWLAGIRTDLEGLGYEVGAADLCAAGVGAPHIRQRLYWVAYADSSKRGRLTVGKGRERNGAQAGRQQGNGEFESGCATGGLADANGRQPRNRGLQRGGGHVQQSEDEAARGLDNPNSNGAQWAGAKKQEPDARCETLRLGDANSAGPQGRFIGGNGANQRTAGASSVGSWDRFNIVHCTDGKARRVEPKFISLADGLSNGLGNSWAGGDGENQKAEKEQVNETQINRDGGAEVRTVREVWMQTPCPPQGRESKQQLYHQLTDLVRLLPSSLALAQLHRDAISEKALSFVRQALLQKRLLRYSPEQVEAQWESISGAERQSVWNTLRDSAIVRALEHPLATNVPGRVGLLRGYGNAIVPELAAQFIQACEEAINP